MDKLYYPSFSIVIPSFNQGQYIARAIQSVLDQDYPYVQLIVVDGLSSDNSIDVIQSFSSHIDVLIVEQDNGQADALIKGFRHADSDIMGWLCSDDQLAKGAFYAIAQRFSSHRPQWWTGSAIRINECNTNKPSQSYSHCKSFKATYQNLVYGGQIINQVSTFWTRELWFQSGAKLANLDYAFDFELWCRFARIVKANPISEVLGFITAHDSSKTSSESGWIQYLNERNFIRSALVSEVPFPASLLLVQFFSRLSLVLNGDYKALLGNRALNLPRSYKNMFLSIDYLYSNIEDSRQCKRIQA